MPDTEPVGPIPSPRSEVFRAAPTSTDDITSALRASPPPASRAISGEPTKRRGRPPGSKNLTPSQRAAKTGIPLDPIEEAKAKAERIKKDAEDMAVWISEELNEHIMTLAMQIPGVTASMLYKEGYAPAATAHISRYTDLGNALAVPTSLAKSASRLYAEAKATEQGQALTGKVSVGKAGLIVAGIGTIFGTMQYAKGVSDILTRVRMMQEAQIRAQEEQAASDSGQSTSEAQRMKAGIVG